MTTNYEKIKNMNLTDLHDFLLDLSDCDICINGNKMDEDFCFEQGCVNGVKQWLNQEVEE